MTEEAATRLHAAGGGSLAIGPEPLEESTVWKPFQQSIHLESRSRGELAQKLPLRLDRFQERIAQPQRFVVESKATSGGPGR